LTLYRSTKDLSVFMKELPTSLKKDLVIIMHSDMIRSIPFLFDKDIFFVSYVAPIMKAVKY
jgi:hypothetical protein